MFITALIRMNLPLGAKYKLPGIMRMWWCLIVGNLRHIVRRRQFTDSKHMRHSIFCKNKIFHRHLHQKNANGCTVLYSVYTKSL